MVAVPVACPVTDKKLEINYIGLVFCINELNRYLIS
jgi:hypothetical protein